tara:strand:+ start:280 stop:651 length:372 start_codon:yes stop_codon:yes gene_type:complete
MSDELDKTSDELDTTHRPYRTINEYTCSLTIPDDETTEVIIKTKSAGVCYASSPEDALKQMKCDQQYSQQSYASHILRYVAENLPNIDLENVDLTYTGEPIVRPMTDDELADFQREVVSLNGY